MVPNRSRSRSRGDGRLISPTLPMEETQINPEVRLQPREDPTEQVVDEGSPLGVTNVQPLQAAGGEAPLEQQQEDRQEAGNQPAERPRPSRRPIEEEMAERISEWAATRPADQPPSDSEGTTPEELRPEPVGLTLILPSIYHRELAAPRRVFMAHLCNVRWVDIQLEEGARLEDYNNLFQSLLVRPSRSRSALLQPADELYLEEEAEVFVDDRRPADAQRGGGRREQAKPAKAKEERLPICLKSRSQVEADARLETRPPLERRKKVKLDEGTEDVQRRTSKEEVDAKKDWSQEPDRMAPPQPMEPVPDNEQYVYVEEKKKEKQHEGKPSGYSWLAASNKYADRLGKGVCLKWDEWQWYPYCVGCQRWADAQHCASARHKKKAARFRVQRSQGAACSSTDNIDEVQQQRGGGREEKLPWESTEASQGVRLAYGVEIGHTDLPFMMATDFHNAATGHLFCLHTTLGKLIGDAQKVTGPFLFIVPGKNKAMVKGMVSQPAIVSERELVLKTQEDHVVRRVATLIQIGEGDLVFDPTSPELSVSPAGPAWPAIVTVYI